MNRTCEKKKKAKNAKAKDVLGLREERNKWIERPVKRKKGAAVVVTWILAMACSQKP